MACIKVSILVMILYRILTTGGNWAKCTRNRSVLLPKLLGNLQLSQHKFQFERQGKTRQDQVTSLMLQPASQPSSSVFLPWEPRLQPLGTAASHLTSLPCPAEGAVHPH